MQKKILALLLACLLLFASCGVGNLEIAETVESTVQESIAPIGVQTEPTEYVPTEEERIDQLADDGIYMLKRAFAFYQGTVEMSEITTITFTDTVPEEYDECWFANVADTADIMGYRCGDEVFIVGEHIYLNQWSAHMFQGYNQYGESFWSNLTEINGLERVSASKAERFDMMFASSKISGTIDGISDWDMSSAKSLEMMFAWATELTELHISNWDVSNVESFTGMFQGNSHAGDMKLQYLDVSQWNVSSAEEMNHMFYGCGLLEYIAVDNWDVRNVKTFSHMFADCFALKGLNLSNWETLSVISFDAFLNDCRSLVTIDISGLDTTTCQQFSQMFEACVNLEEIIGLDKWDVSNASYYAFSETFHCCYKLKSLNIGSWDTSPDNTARMVKNCYELGFIDMSGFDMSNIETVTEMFMGCGKLKTVVGLELWTLNDVQGYDSAFTGCGLY